MKILVACEESQAVTIELRKLGHEAYSCDIEPCSGGHPEWHLQQDVIPLLKEKWDMIIAFPPCTDLCVSGAAWFEKKRANGSQRKSIEFFMQFLNADCNKIAIENPVGIISGDYIKKWFPDLQVKYKFPIKPTQKIQPWEYGDEAQKTTCLWLKGLSPLVPIITEMPPIEFFEWVDKRGIKKRQALWYYNCSHTKGKSGLQRSKTFPGIAKALANQYGGDIRNERINGITTWE